MQYSYSYRKLHVLIEDILEILLRIFVKVKYHQGWIKNKVLHLLQLISFLSPLLYSFFRCLFLSIISFRFLWLIGVLFLIRSLFPYLSISLIRLPFVFIFIFPLLSPSLYQFPFLFLLSFLKWNECIICNYIQFWFLSFFKCN